MRGDPLPAAPDLVDPQEGDGPVGGRQRAAHDRFVHGPSHAEQRRAAARVVVRTRFLNVRNDHDSLVRLHTPADLGRERFHWTGIERRLDVRPNPQVRILFQSQTEPGGRPPAGLEAEALQLLVVGHASPLQDVPLCLVHQRRVAGPDVAGDLGRDDSRRSPIPDGFTPEQPQPCVAQDDRSLHAPAGKICRPAGTDIHERPDEASGRGREGVDRERHPIAFFRQHRDRVPLDRDRAPGVIPARSTVGILLDANAGRRLGGRGEAGTHQLLPDVIDGGVVPGVPRHPPVPLHHLDGVHGFGAVETGCQGGVGLLGSRGQPLLHRLRDDDGTSLGAGSHEHGTLQQRRSPHGCGCSSMAEKSSSSSTPEVS